MPDVDLVTRDGEVRIGELLRGLKFLLVDLTGDATYEGMDLSGLPVLPVSGVPVLTPTSIEGLTSILV